MSTYECIISLVFLESKIEHLHRFVSLNKGTKRKKSKGERARSNSEKQEAVKEIKRIK
jgi:hypothetical protein